MTKLLPILFACYMHLFSGKKAYENQTYLGSLIFFLSMMDLLYGNEILPKKYCRMGRLFKVMLETFFVWIISEMTMRFFWTKLEGSIDFALRFITEADGTRFFLLEVITVSLGLLHWGMISAVTHQQYGLYNFLFRTCYNKIRELVRC
ncbi:GL23599 [Drosophila persimilis]|uniref:GL23599 n=1 Tax=Drosophila persimilis TaxID=7234 RepID=B4G2I7_DROPE|nr:GL23599 [Drosophila persimilis]